MWDAVSPKFGTEPETVRCYNLSNRHLTVCGELTGLL